VQDYWRTWILEFGERNSAENLKNSEMLYHLAQINIGRLIAPIDDPRIAEFAEGLAPMNALADGSPGFVWRLQSDSGNATDISFSEDPTMLVNMSVWESLEALRNYTYRSEHIQFFRKRAHWFQKLDKPHYCLWWVTAGHRPSVAEGRERIEHYQERGATPFSFWFSQHFPTPADESVCA
jgi:heme-degrading monooxygenase HmoA